MHGLMVPVGIRDVEVQTRQGAIVPPLQQVTASRLLHQAAELPHARLRLGARILVSGDHLLDLRVELVERRHHFAPRRVRYSLRR
jgi:hypothetical protein